MTTEERQLDYNMLYSFELNEVSNHVDTQEQEYIVEREGDLKQLLYEVTPRSIIFTTCGCSQFTLRIHAGATCVCLEA